MTPIIKIITIWSMREKVCQSLLYGSIFDTFLLSIWHLFTFPIAEVFFFPQAVSFIMFRVCIIEWNQPMEIENCVNVPIAIYLFSSIPYTIATLLLKLQIVCIPFKLSLPSLHCRPERNQGSSCKEYMPNSTAILVLLLLPHPSPVKGILCWSFLRIAAIGIFFSNSLA